MKQITSSRSEPDSPNSLIEEEPPELAELQIENNEGVNPADTAEMNMEAYYNAKSQIEARVDKRHPYYGAIDSYLENIPLISCLSKPEHHKIYGKNVRILSELLVFLSPRIQYAPALLKKILDLKNLYGEDHYAFKNVTDLLTVTTNGNILIEMDARFGVDEDAKKKESTAKTKIGTIINTMTKEINRLDRKNKRRGRGLSDFDITPYRNEILKVIAGYLDIKAIQERELQKIVDTLLMQEEVKEGDILKVTTTIKVKEGARAMQYQI